MANPSSFSAIEFHQSGDDAPLTPKQGGQVVRLKAGATLLVGDVVYLSADGTVNKSSVQLTVQGKLVGVVVGGKQTDSRVFTCTAAQVAAGVTAANTNEEVLVCYQGVAYVVAGAATAIGHITVSTVTSGRIAAATVLQIAAGATPVTSAAANGANTINGYAQSLIVGKLLEAATGAGQAKLALINLY